MKTAELEENHLEQIEKSIQSDSTVLVQCKYKNLATMFCVNQNCSAQSIFVCDLRGCSCNKQHKKCCRAPVQHAEQELKRKIIDPSTLISFLENTFDSIIDKISQLRDDLIENIKNTAKYANLSDLDQKFLEIIQKNQPELDFLAKDSKCVWDKINKVLDQESMFERLEKIMKDFEIRLTKNVILTVESYNEMLKNYEVRENQQLLLNKQIGSLSSLFEFNCRKLLSISSIVQKTEEAQNLLNFLQQKVLDIDLLFKASQNNFDVTKYMEKYGKERNVLLIVKTNADKTIGAFTPLSLEFTGTGQLSQNGNEWVKDPTQQTFIYSLTNNDKFIHKGKKSHICRYKSKDKIQFGQDLWLVNQSQKKNSLSTLNQNFYNQNYIEDDETSFMHFHGNPTNEFITKEWQVWKVEFRK